MRTFEERLKTIAASDVKRLLIGREKYGNSWRKRGGREAYFNVTRKIDRIERACAQQQTDCDLFAAIRNTPASDGDIGGKDGLLDDIRELRHYLMLTEEFITRKRGDNDED
jgi:hypothetical protein